MGPLYSHEHLVAAKEETENELSGFFHSHANLLY